MLKYITFILISLFFVACGNEERQTALLEPTGEYLLVQKSSDYSLPVATNQKISLYFSADLLPSTVNQSNIYIEYIPIDPYGTAGEPYPIGTYLSDGVSSKNVIVTPYEYFEPNANYRVVITTGVEDVYGRSLAEEYIFTFQTQDNPIDTTPLTLRATKPASGATSVYVESEIVMDFNKNLSAEPTYSTNQYLSVVDGAGNTVEGKVEVFNSLMKFTPFSTLPADSNITVSVNQPIKDIYGNQFDAGYSWTFQTKSVANTPDTTLGYTLLNLITTNKTSYFIRTLEDDVNSSTFVVAREGAIDLYSVAYQVPKSIPTMAFLDSYTLSGQITSLETSAPYVIVGTLNSGIYILTDNSGSLVEVTHLDVGSSIYTYSFVPDRIYSMNPATGMQMYDFNATAQTATLFADVNSSVVGESIDAVDNYYGDRRVYVADYSGGVVTLENNASFVARADINGSVKELFTLPYTKIYTVSTSGVVNAVEYNGTLDATFRYDVPRTINETTLYTDYVYSSAYFATDSGFAIANSTGISYIVNKTREVASVSVVHPYDANSVDQTSALFVISLAKDGSLELFNESYDADAPLIEYTYPGDGDQNISLDIDITLFIADTYLDEATLSADKFVLLNSDTNTAVAFSFSSYKDSYSPGYFVNIIPDANLSSATQYNLSISSAIQDIFGRELNNGVDVNVSFTTE